MEQLYIAIDPGFDSMKIVANREAFKFPFNVVETDERRMQDYALRSDFLMYKGRLGTTYRVGQYARELVFENKQQAEDKMAGFYDEERFVSEEFSVGLDTAIALAIDKVGLYTNQDDLDIHLIVALPHALRDKFASTIIGRATGEHSFSLRAGTDIEKAYHFTIKSNQVKTVSQTIAAILGETSNESGNVDARKAFYLTQGPTLVLDGGYYTFGMVAVSRGGTVDNSKTESDTLHAMKNVNMKITDAIREVRPDVQHYIIEYLLSKNEGMIRYISKDGKAETIDLKKIKKHMVREVCTDFIQYLNVKYNNLLDFSYVLVTGGTGASYFRQMLNYYKELGLFNEDNFLLTSSELGGKHYPIEYAIAIGAYKGLKATG